MWYVRNAWYVAAWSEELGATPLGRRIVGSDVVLFRREDGSPAALDDRCPHRFAPLRLGRVRDGRIECGYHGLQFDGGGTCVHNPHGPQRPKALNVRSWPTEERHGIVWIWPGDPEHADPAAIPDFGYLVEPGRRTVFGGKHLQANYQLIADNLMDASHTQYVHHDLLGTDAFARSRHEVIEDDGSVQSNYVVPDSRVPTAYRAYFEASIQVVEYSVNFLWRAPGLVRNSVSLTPPDRPQDAIRRIGTHLMTPATEFTTHYFFAHTRNFSLDDEEVDQRTRWWQQTGLVEQDGPMIEACQASMGAISDLDSLRPALLGIDRAAVAVRRKLAARIRAESAAAR